MKIKYLLLLAALGAANASAQDATALTCDDFRPTEEARERFPNLAGACEGIVEVKGELYAKFTAKVRNVWGNNLTLFLPATGKIFTTRPDSALRVLVGDKKVRPSELARGQDIHIYLSVSEFAKPDIEEVAFVTEEDVVIDVTIEEVEALPKTASPWPAIFAAGLFLLGAGYLLRRRRLGRASSLALLAGVALAGVAPVSDAETRDVQIPGKVVTSVVQKVAIVEAVDKETREIKLIDADGDRFSIVASDMVRNFDQIEPRDRIVVEYLESVAVFVVPDGMPELEDSVAVEVAPLGDKPGIKAAETTMVEATIEALNLTDRIAVLRTEAGLMSVKLSDQVPLDKIRIGDGVRLRVTQAMAVSVRAAPQG